MDVLTLTILISFALVIIALCGLSIGWLVTGKSKIIKGACGMDPNRLRDKRCGTDKIKCELCENEKKDDE